MKRGYIFSSIILLITVGCIRNGKQTAGDIIVVDVTKTNYPKKELILQDFMDVEYIPLETKDDFINQGFVQTIGNRYIIVTNRPNIRDGNIFIYNSTGKAIRKINRQGQGPEEYTYITRIILDEENNEMFVHDHFIRKIHAYDLHGKFKRSFDYRKDVKEMFYTDIFNYDNYHLICYDAFNMEVGLFVLLSKQDGNITHRFNIPIKEKKFLRQFLREDGVIQVTEPGPYRAITPFKDDWLLIEFSSDTIYTLLPDLRLSPFLIRTPSIQTMDTEVMLLLRLLTDRYIFMETIRNEFDWETDRGFHQFFFMYDKFENSFFRYAVYNDDFISKREMYMVATRPVNHEIESWYPLEAHRLVESYSNGELKGKLKEIAATLDDDSNPVIMLIKHKMQ